MRTELYTRWEFDSNMQKSKARNVWFCKLENIAMSFAKKQDQIAKLRAFTHLEIKKIDSFNVDGYCDHCKTVIEAMICYYNFCPCQETRPHWVIKILREEAKGERVMIWGRNIYSRKRIKKIDEKWECEWLQ